MTELLSDNMGFNAESLIQVFIFHKTAAALWALKCNVCVPCCGIYNSPDLSHFYRRICHGAAGVGSGIGGNCLTIKFTKRSQERGTVTRRRASIPNAVL